MSLRWKNTFETFLPIFMNRVQLPQDCRATKRGKFTLTTKSPGVPGIHLIYT